MQFDSTANGSPLAAFATGRPLTSASHGIQTVAGVVLRYGLVVIILWFGVFKFTPSEARAIQPLLANSPFFSWLYHVTDVRGASRVIGVAEIVIAILIALRPFSRRACAIGSVGAVAMFLSTLSFLGTTPGMWATVDGLFVPSGGGGFVIKDLLLLGAALWSTGESLAKQ
jgi:reactive chlorine resistance protein C